MCAGSIRTTHRVDERWCLMFRVRISNHHTKVCVPPTVVYLHRQDAEITLSLLHFASSQLFFVLIRVLALASAAGKVKGTVKGKGKGRYLYP